MKQSKPRSLAHFVGGIQSTGLMNLADTNFSVMVNRIIAMLAVSPRNRRQLTNGTREHRTTQGNLHDKEQAGILQRAGRGLPKVQGIRL
jgi:hypothetical protein